jgi:hypothetical protein
VGGFGLIASTGAFMIAQLRSCCDLIVSLESHKRFETNRLLPPRPLELPLSPSRFDFIVNMIAVEVQRSELAATKLSLRSLADLPGGASRRH